MIRRPPRSTQSRSSAASDVYKRQAQDVLVTKGKVAELGKELKPGKNTKVVDARDMLVLPGFVDLHAHLRTPGREDEEDVATGSRAAAAGGYVATVSYT